MDLKNETFQIRRMRADETDLIREWAAGEGWNPGLHDANCFYATDPQGFFLGEVDGQPVAMISCVAYDSSYGFLGLYIVKAAYRGHGYGLRTWQEGMKYLGTRTVGLDGVLAQQQNYERSGFRFSHHHVRYERVSGGTPLPASDFQRRAPRLEADRARHIVPLSTIPEADLVAYDTARAPAPRPHFLQRWLHLRDSYGFASIQDGKLRGFGLVRPCVVGFKIGPLLADDAVVAEDLLRGLLAAAPSGPVFLDVPDTTPVPRNLALHFGMHEVFRTARMYTRPTSSHEHVFGIASMELG
ncbi:GNAT family N-acetyltransferase [Pendulispora rubella]|uniref:GNAT family N-acetyltransferase n=1 Tax=Pendulispora rubella TaxID=2741070 RepID=A0ABZ2KU28_9BACT